MTAAHTTLPIPSLVKVTRNDTGDAIIVRINDRGPFADNRIIDLSEAAAERLGFKNAGTTDVRVEFISDAPVEPNTLPPQAIAFNTRTKAARGAQSVTRHATRPHSSSMSQFRLQLGSFSEIGNAHQLRSKLANLNGVKIEEAYVNGRELFRVVAGEWSSRSSADHARNILQKQGIDAIVVSLK